MVGISLILWVYGRQIMGLEWEKHGYNGRSMICCNNKYNQCSNG